ncbi:hypothetical protein SCYAM73S_00907 [Streptomyces cyaneofuscatus]
MNMISCATASRAYARCTWSWRFSTLGHRARTLQGRCGDSGDDDGRVRQRERAEAGDGQQGHAERGEHGGGELDTRLPVQVHRPAEQRLSDGGGEAVRGGQGAGQRVAAALGAGEQHDRDVRGAVGQPPHQRARQQPGGMPRPEDVQISRGHTRPFPPDDCRHPRFYV